MQYSLDKITTSQKAVFLAYDQGLEHGPADFSDENIDPTQILEIAAKAQLNAVVFQRGIAEKYYAGSIYVGKVPLIVKLNGKTSYIKNEPYAPQICTVDEAISFGAVAVGYTVYVGSQRQDLMFKEFTQIEKDAHAKGMPVIMWSYPRGSVVDENDPKTIAYAARVALELGADMVKLKYTGDIKTFSWVVKSAGRTKVIMSGGPKTDTPEEFYEQVKGVMASGATGVAVGRNVWQADNPVQVADRVREIVFGEITRI